MDFFFLRYIIMHDIVLAFIADFAFKVVINVNNINIHGILNSHRNRQLKRYSHWPEVLQYTT